MLLDKSMLHHAVANKYEMIDWSGMSGEKTEEYRLARLICYNKYHFDHELVDTPVKYHFVRFHVVVKRYLNSLRDETADRLLWWKI